MAGMRSFDCEGKCGCKAGMGRREFLRIGGAGAVSLLASGMPIMAGPFERADFEKLVPADKKLHPDWVKSLFARGRPTVYRGEAELRYIGMPVGGITCGQLYLGGDGKLWHWDIFNQHLGTNEAHYAHPPLPSSPIEQGFSLRVDAGGASKTYGLDRTGFADVSFCGQYPIGTVQYEDPGCPLAVTLEAFSPFIPLNTEDSSLPATVLQFTLRNRSAAAVEATFSGRLENGVCLNHRGQEGVLRNRVIREAGLTTLLCSAEKAAAGPTGRADIVFENWSKETYEGWNVEGAAFGRGPVNKSEVPAYQGDVGGDTARVVNSHASAPGDSVGEKDRAVGKLTSGEFTIERRFITFWIGGGKAQSPSRLGLTLLVDGKPVQTAAGEDRNEMALKYFDVRALAGQKARLEIVDDATGGWGNVGVGRIVFTDQMPTDGPLEELPDFGTMALALPGEAAEEASGEETALFAGKLTGGLGRKLKLGPGESARVTFVLAWHFPNLSLGGPLQKAGRHYATRFASAQEVARYVGEQLERLAGETRLWRETWYDSTLPNWFLERTFLNTSILATSTCYRFANGRFYGWEGVGCCEGTCGHVYHYAHATARLFPDLERSTRERIDFGIALQADGAIHFRGEFGDFPAVDAQAGTVLRALREHEMSAEGAFLKRNWPKIKLATQWLIGKDGNGDGLIEGNQHNTLDTDWYGPVAWLSGLYLAALAAAAEMADEAGDTEFAGQCRGIFERGQKNFVAQLFDGEYFIDKVDPKHLDAINSGTGCEIDQVFGQSWALQVGLPRVLPRKETKSALQSLWRYNFSPDVGPYRAAYKTRALVCDGGGGWIADVHVSAGRLGLRAGQGQRRGLGGGLL